MSRIAAGLLAVLALATLAEAQQRPLVTQDPEPIGAGRWLLDVGLDWTANRFYPASGLSGDLLRLPLVGVHAGLGAIGELQIDGGFYNRLAVAGRQDAPLSGNLEVAGHSTFDVEDFVVATKVRVLAERGRRPALGVRLATRLPNATTRNGLGLDTTDFLATLLAGKTVQAFRLAGNVGIGILGNPLRADSQNDVVECGASITRTLTGGIELVSEVEGRVHVRHDEAPPGTGSRGAVRAGGRYRRSGGTFDFALVVGLTSSDGDWGIGGGYTRVF